MFRAGRWFAKLLFVCFFKEAWSPCQYDTDKSSQTMKDRKQQAVKSDFIVLSHWHSKTHSVQAEIHSSILTTLLPLGLDGACNSQSHLPPSLPPSCHGSYLQWWKWACLGGGFTLSCHLLAELKRHSLLGWFLQPIALQEKKESHVIDVGPCLLPKYSLHHLLI